MFLSHAQSDKEGQMRNTRIGKDRFGVHRPLKTGGSFTKKSNRSGNRGKQNNDSQPVSTLPTQAENDPAYITSEALNATKYGSYATAALGALSAVPVFVKALGIQNLSNSIVYTELSRSPPCASSPSWYSSGPTYRCVVPRRSPY